MAEYFRETSKDKITKESSLFKSTCTSSSSNHHRTIASSSGVNGTTIDRFINRETPGASTCISRGYGSHSILQPAICKPTPGPEMGIKSEFGRDLTAYTDNYSTMAGTRTGFETSHSIVTTTNHTSLRQDFSSSNYGTHSTYYTCSQCALSNYSSHSRQTTCSLQREPREAF